MKILFFRLKNNNFQFLLSIVCALTSFLYIKTWNISFIIFSSLIFLTLVTKPKLIAIFLFALACLMLVSFFVESAKITKYINGKYYVKKTLTNGIIIEENNSNILVFTKKNLNINDYIYVQGKPIITQKKYYQYLMSLNAKSVIFNPKIYLLSKSESLFSMIYNYFNSGPFFYRKMMSLIFLGQKNVNNYDFYKLASGMNLAHLFVVSGFHIWLIYKIIEKILFKLKIIYKDICGITICFIYILILNFPLSALRAFLMLLGIRIQKYYNYKIKKFTMIGIILFIVVIIDPFSVYGYSLPLTFIATIIIQIINQLEISKIKKMLLLPLIIYLSILPFVISISGKISFIGPVFTIIITPIFSIIFVICLFLFWFKNIINFLLSWFDKIIISLQKFNFTLNIASYFNFYFYLIYFLFIILFIIYEIWNWFLVRKNT